MLQIISGKFFESTERHSSEGKGILYSNIALHNKIDTSVATLEPADVYGQTSAYILSYNNQIEKDPKAQGFSLVRTGDAEILRQFKYICTFGLRAIFEEDRNVVYKMCRENPISSHEHYVPSGYINRILDLGIYAQQKEIDEFVAFVEDLIGLPREVYNTIINCLGAYEAAIKLLDDDINSAYSMLIYCAETLSKRFYTYNPVWDDYPQDQRVALEKCFNGLAPNNIVQIKNILIKDSHLKLTKRFANFLLQYLDESFFLDDAYTLGRAVKKDEIERALINAYNTRSRYVHNLEPIIRNLTNTHVFMAK